MWENCHSNNCTQSAIIQNGNVCVFAALCPQRRDGLSGMGPTDRPDSQSNVYKNHPVHTSYNDKNLAQCIHNVSMFRTFQPEIPVPVRPSRSRQERNVSPGELHQFTSSVLHLQLTILVRTYPMSCDVYLLTVDFWCMSSDVYLLTVGFWCLSCDVYLLTVGFWCMSCSVNVMQFYHRTRESFPIPTMMISYHSNHDGKLEV